MAACWVSQNSGPIIRHLWSKVHRIKFACAFATLFSNQWWLIKIRRYSRFTCKTASKIAPKLWCFWAAKFRGEGLPKILTEFYKSGSPSNMCQSLVMIGQATSQMRQWKKDINYSSKTEWPASWQAAINTNKHLKAPQDLHLHTSMKFKKNLVSLTSQPSSANKTEDGICVLVIGGLTPWWP